MEEALEQTAQTTSCRSFLGVVRVLLASELTIKRKFSCICNPVLIGQNVCVHAGHIHVSFAFGSFSLIIGNFPLNNGVDK